MKVVFLACLAGCSFELGITTSTDAAIDTPSPVVCGDLTCDPAAICMESSSGASCACSTGYAGNGMTCTAIDACATNNGGCPAACETTGPGTHVCYVPRTCADVAAHTTLVDDSTVTLYAGADPTKPWQAFCHGGLEYLTAASATSNFGQYTAGNKSPGMNVRTTFARLRVDPMTLAIDICDRAFATSTGTLSHDPAFNEPDIIVSAMPLGAAMDCGGSGSQSGTAAINLTNTPFVVSSNWSLGGGGAAGNANKAGGGRTVTITGGGNCGWNAPSGAPGNPFNTCTNLKLVTLTYTP